MEGRKILNDPKTDEFYIPVRALKRAYKMIKNGKPRQTVALMIVEQMNKAAVRRPEVVERFPWLKEHHRAQFKIINRRLRMVDPDCEEFADYTRLLNRFRSRKHEKKRTRFATEAQKEAQRKRHREYQRERRKNPEILERNRRYTREHYQRRKEEDPMEHEVYLYYKRVKRREDKKDPVKLARLQEHARVSQQKRKARYHSDPQYREEEKAKNRARYHRRRATGWIPKHRRKEEG